MILIWKGVDRDVEEAPLFLECAHLLRCFDIVVKRWNQTSEATRDYHQLGGEPVGHEY